MAKRPWEMPSPDHVRTCIETWRRMDLRHASDQQVRQSLLDLRDDIGRFAAQTRQCKPSRLWRIRKVAEAEIKSRSDLMYPPVRSARLSRCNAQGRSVLYTAQDGPTAFEECSVNEQAVICLIKYRVKRHLVLARIMGEEHPRDLEGKELFSPSGLEAYQLLRTFLQDEFSKRVSTEPGQEYGYRLSAAICEVWASADDADGWMYPSVHAPGFDNVAIKAEAADQVIEIEEAFIVQVMSLRQFYVPRAKLILPGIEAVILRRATVTGDEVKWEDSTGIRAFLHGTKLSISED